MSVCMCVCVCACISRPACTTSVLLLCVCVCVCMQSSVGLLNGHDAAAAAAVHPASVADAADGAHAVSDDNKHTAVYASRSDCSLLADKLADH